MGQQMKKTLLLSIIVVGFSLLGRAHCKEREEKQVAEHRENENITPSPLVGSSNGWRPVIPSNDETVAMSRSQNYRHISNEADNKHLNINQHPVLNKLHQHMESAEKAKIKRLQDEAAAYSTRAYDGPYYSTTPNILGTFSNFGHATVRNKEPAVTKQEIVKGKKKKHDPHSYQVTESINEYSLHLVPPPRNQKVPTQYPLIMTEMRRKKPHPGYRYPSPDLIVEEQRHSYFVQPAPSRPPYIGLQSHTPKPPTYFFGGPQIPSFSGHNGPHHYPGALAGALFPGPDSIRYFQRPEMHNSGGSQYIHPQPIPLDGNNQARPQENGDQNNESPYRRPDQSPFKTSVRQEDFVTGRPSHEVRAPDTSSFTVGTSFLAGNKQADNIRPSLIVQNTAPQQFYNPNFSTIQAPAFEHAFETGRPSNKEVVTSYRIPTTLTNSHAEKVRNAKPFVPEEAVKNVQITGPGSNYRQQQFDSMFPPGVVEDVAEEVAPHFLPTVTSDSSPTFLTDSQAHFNEVSQSNRPWGQHISTAAPIRSVEIELQGPANIPDELTTIQTPPMSEERPYKLRRPATTVAIVLSTQAQKELEEQDSFEQPQRFESSTERRPSFEEESVTELPTLPPTAQAERRPYQPRKPIRHRPRPTQQREEDDGSYRPAQYTSKHAEAGTPTEVRPKQRRRRPTVPSEKEILKTLSAVDEDDAAKYNHVSAALDGVYDKINPATTPRPSRRKNPYGSVRGQDRHRVRTSTTENIPIAEAFEAVTETPVAAAESVVQYQGAKEYSVHEDIQEADDIVTKPNEEDFTQELPSTTSTTTSTTTPLPTTTTTTTTTPPPTTTTAAPVASTTSRYKPRTRYGTNSTRPRFSVKDYKERLNRLSHLSSTEPKNETTTQSSVDVESAPKLRYPGRIRGSIQKQDEVKSEEDVTAPEVAVESMRHKYRPKFGLATSRYRTTTTSPTAAAEESNTERVGSKLSTPRLRLPPTGKYYSRYRTSTETPIEEKIDHGNDRESSPIAKVQLKSKAVYSPRRRFPPRAKYGAQNEINVSDHAEDNDSSNSNSELVKAPAEAVTLRQEYTTNFEATEIDSDETKAVPTISNMFSSFEDLSQSFDNEVVTKPSKTFLYLPTLPTTLQFDSESQTVKDFDYGNSREDSTTEKNVTDIDSVDLSDDEGVSASQRVADLTSAATSGGYFNTMLIAKRKQTQYVMSTEDPILPIEAFFTNKEYHKE